MSKPAKEGAYMPYPGSLLTQHEPAPAPSGRSLLGRLGALIAARRRAVLGVGALALVLAGLFGGPAINNLVDSRYESPNSESVHAAQVLERDFAAGSPNLVLLVGAESGSIDDPAAVRAGTQLAEELAAKPGVRDVRSYWSERSIPTLRGADGRSALVLAWLPGSETTVRDRLAELVPELERDREAITVRAGGSAEVFRDAADQARQDLRLAELIIFPAAFLLLALLLRSLVAAALAMAVAIFTIIGTLALLRAVMVFTDISTFAANLTLVLGLGLGVDYSLFVITRFREELHIHGDRRRAAIRTLQTSGRTVVFSGITVATSLSALFVLPFPFLRSFAYTGIAIVVSGIVGSVVILPAALVALGRRVDRGRRPRRHLTGAFWPAIVTRVMRRPVLAGGSALLVLLLLGAPFLGVRFGPPDDRVLPADAGTRQVYDVIRADYVAEEADAIQIVAPDLGGAPTGGDPRIADYAARLSTIDGVVRVDALTGSYSHGERAARGATTQRFAGENGTWLSVIVRTDRLDAERAHVVDEIRAVPAPFQVTVGGYPATLVDYQRAVLDRLPLALTLVLVITFIILFLMTGSVLIPIKATIANVLSLSVMFGALVWIFQHGNLAGLLRFTPTGTLEASIPILMFCVAYGLSMDYEVFMMARIGELYRQTGDNQRAVLLGLQRSAPLITSAAAILALSFAVYAISGITLMKMLGIGTALAIIVDATLIRVVLVPAALRLAGGANWWAPRPLRRLHSRFGPHESS
jgi:RND superfamily putative drug exporter